MILYVKLKKNVGKQLFEIERELGCYQLIDGIVLNSHLAWFDWVEENLTHCWLKRRSGLGAPQVIGGLGKINNGGNGVEKW